MDSKTIYLLVVWILSASCEEDWESLCNRCICLWSSGKSMAKCAGRGLDTIPDDPSAETRVIDFSNNVLHYLGPGVFSKAHLSGVQKLKLRNCGIGEVHESAFSGLTILIELNLANNNIKTLKKNVFRDNVELRKLILSHNKIKVLEGGLFHNLTSLQQILLDHNEIEIISEQTFQVLPALKHISLAHNKIQRITFDMKSHLPELTSLSLEGNPWICDCHLRDFRNSAQQNNLITFPITCQSPLRLQGRSWLDNIEFACEPKVVEAGPYPTIEAQTANISLTCKVVGDPTPSVDWATDGTIIESDSSKKIQKYSTSRNTIAGFTWNNLTIINVAYEDRGDYMCVAKNPGGKDSKRVTFVVTAGAFADSRIIGYTTNTYLIHSLFIGSLLVLLTVIIILFRSYKKSTRGFHSKRRDYAGSTEEFAQCLHL